MKFTYPEGATPFNQDDLVALIPNHIETQDQLNEWEQANILKAEVWLFSRKHKDILSIKFLKSLHKKMFDETWKWAGEFRTGNTNIGVQFYYIQEKLTMLLGDVLFWIEQKTYPIDEIAARFHHKLVLIHPFPNGNGRHARLITDRLLVDLGYPRFSWGKGNLTKDSEIRRNYINSLRKADGECYDDLIKFVRS